MFVCLLYLKKFKFLMRFFPALGNFDYLISQKERKIFAHKKMIKN